MKIITLGIDLAKNVFMVRGVDEFGKVALVRPSVRRDQLLELIATIPPCVIGMEACSGAAAPRKTDRLSRWTRSVKERRGHGKAQVAVAVAVAAKNARMALAVYTL